MELKRPVEAAAAFEVAQQRGRGQVASDATYGRTLALLAAGLTADAAIAAAGGNLPAARRNELTASLTTQRALTAYREGRYQEALINLDERARILPEQTDLMVLRGWSYYNLGPLQRRRAGLQCRDAHRHQPGRRPRPDGHQAEDGAAARVTSRGARGARAGLPLRFRPHTLCD